MSKIRAEDAAFGAFYRYNTELLRCVSTGLNVDDFRLFINAANEIREVFRDDRVRTLPATATSFDYQDAVYDIEDALDTLTPGDFIRINPGGGGTIRDGGGVIFSFADKAELDVYVDNFGP